MTKKIPCFESEKSTIVGVTYKTAWYMLYRIRTAMSQRDERYLLAGEIEFDNAYIGGPTLGKNVVVARIKKKYSAHFR